jgi:hypothetical protein
VHSVLNRLLDLLKSLGTLAGATVHRSLLQLQFPNGR